MQLHSPINEATDQHKTSISSTQDVGLVGSQQAADQCRNLHQRNELETEVPAMFHEHSSLCMNELAQRYLHLKQHNLTSSECHNTNVNCLKVCKDSNVITNCSKVVLVEVFMEGVPKKSRIVYCMIDEMASTSFVDDELLEYFGRTFPCVSYNVNFAPNKCYVRSCGQLVKGLSVKGVLSQEVVSVGEALSCRSLPAAWNEVATPDIALAYAHCRPYAHLIPPYNANLKVQLLIGRTCLRACYTTIVSEKQPYLHCTPLGYTIVGNVCIKGGDEGEVVVYETSDWPAWIRRQEDKPVHNNDPSKQMNRSLGQHHEKFRVDNRCVDDMHHVYCNRINAAITQGNSATADPYGTADLHNDCTEDIRHVFCNSINVSTMPPVDFTLNLQSDEVARGTQSVEYPDDMSSWAVTNIFSQHIDDDELDSSQDDQLFLNMMNEGARVTKEGHVELPLPLKPGVSLPDNRFSVLKRTENSCRTLQKTPWMLDQCVEAMAKDISKGYVEELDPQSPPPPQG